jgi:hypothetical protein
MINVSRRVGWTAFCGIAIGALVLAGCGGDGDEGVQPQATGSISGTLVHAGTGLPLGGVQIVVGGVTTTTADDGTFTLSGVPAGVQTIGINADPERELALPPGGAPTVTVVAGQNTQLGDPILVIDAPDLPPNPPS